MLINDTIGVIQRSKPLYRIGIINIINNMCPLCMEQLDLDELNFFPCKCGYQVCQFCWNRIKQEENGLCPACRQPYPDQPVDFKPFSAEELKKIQLERRKRDQQRKQKMSENRKHLANMRVVQKNLVLVHGMPP
uniref:RING-type domain-containing protein n=1 Tax=Romanomermis culicivorax TaxID=13658 RepID=A0A915KZV9_ROMCU